MQIFNDLNLANLIMEPIKFAGGLVIALIDLLLN